MKYDENGKRPRKKKRMINKQDRDQKEKMRIKRHD